MLDGATAFSAAGEVATIDEQHPHDLAEAKRAQREKEVAAQLGEQRPADDRAATAATSPIKTIVTGSK